MTGFLLTSSQILSMSAPWKLDHQKHLLPCIPRSVATNSRLPSLTLKNGCYLRLFLPLFSFKTRWFFDSRSPWLLTEDAVRSKHISLRDLGRWSYLLLRKWRDALIAVSKPNFLSFPSYWWYLDFLFAYISVVVYQILLRIPFCPTWKKHVRNT